MGNPVLFCNVGWMNEYQGITSTDKIVGGGAYVRLEKRGGETCNFLPVKGKVFGYVQPRGTQIKIERIGASKTDQQYSGVDVVFTARRPGGGGTVVIGWFKNATVFRNPQSSKWLSNTHKNNKIDTYWISGSASNAVLLPIDQRNIGVPRGKGGIGQSNVWFADSHLVAAWVSEVKRTLGGGKSVSARRGSARQQDPIKRAQVEKVAIETATAYYEKMGYAVVSVEKDNLGWDLEASKDKLTLLLEVKGLSGSQTIAEITPNEYRQMNGNRRADYRLCIVTSTLSTPGLRVFSLNHITGKWVSDADESVLSIKERIGAVVSCI